MPDTDLVDLFYEAALDTQLWPSALARLSDAVGGEGVALTYQNQFDGTGRAIFSRLDPAMAPLYFGHFGQRNPIQLANDLEAVRRDGPGVGPDHLHVPRAELERSEYFNDFMVPFGIHSVLMIGLAVHNADISIINIMRPKSKAAFDAEETSFARALRPHLARAFEVSRRLGETRQLGESVSSLLSRVAQAFFLLDATCRIRFANASAEAMVAANDGLRVEAGMLATARADTTRQLGALIGKAAQESAEVGSAMLLPRRSGRRPYSLIVSPLRMTTTSFFASGPCVAVCVTDPDSETPLSLLRLRELFGLTPAETRVAGEILLGHDRKAIAKTLGLSTNTVRVHTTSLLAKTQTKRQPELVRLMMQLSSYDG